MSIADDPFFGELPQASRDRIKVAVIERELIIRNGDAQAREIVEVFHRELDPLGIDRLIDGPSQAVLTARGLREERRAQADGHLFTTAIAEWWECLKPDVEAFMAKALGTWRLVYPNVEIQEDHIRWLQARALRLGTAASKEKADSRNAAQPSRNKAAAARSGSEYADKLRRRIRKMASQGYTQERMCRTLAADGWSTPEGVSWAHLGWVEALNDRDYGASVKTYLSKRRA